MKELSFERLEVIVERLEDLSGTESTYFIFHEGSAPLKEFMKFQKFINQEIPDEIRQFYTISRGLSLHLIYHAPIFAPYILGNSSITGLNSFVNGPRMTSPATAKKGERLKGYLWDMGEDKTIINQLEADFFILDYIDTTGSTYTVFKIEKSKNKAQLFLYKYPHRLYPLCLSFLEYLNACCEYRALHCWQDYFIDRKATKAEDLAILQSERPDQFLSNIKTIHPDADLSRLVKTPEEHTYSFIQLAKQKKYCDQLNERSTELADQLETEGFEFDLTVHDPISIHTIRKIEYVLGHPLPDKILAFYTQLNGFSLEWTYPKEALYGKKPEYFPYAKFDLLGLDQVFGGFEPWKTRIWHDQMFEGIVTMPEVMDEAEMAFAKECRLLYSSEQDQVVIHFKGPGKDSELYLIEQGNFLPITLDFESFIAELLSNMGMINWPWFFTKPSDLTDAELAVFPPVPTFIKNVFPGADTSRYRQVKSNIELKKD